ncbi:MAG: hypothetical protein A3G05_02330 [Candidatus Zambryskibacteria bacterium RIFCSPLOWO2_12_FULL_45_14]|uniref:Uncharacterized protein n=2 Tax=Candidatus Zambryskiibacteriota TaxID=1817925 RepID=A0A1G2UN48_9BACT|nr:MAG: hypothetical protein A3H60_01220 [Candidatus Zambryskibacteria bacterium RIFCSPLOWO2_02_FULL_44_12b]OHB13584.1 MAG: hypothetical protein A3G05_02330 [Candidatus Zambryskibacteria bacterium RIFCSPLOWO2_12_FULL_45_14]
MEEAHEEKSNQPPPLKQIRTFQGDVAEALQRQQESLVSIQRAEHLKRGSIEPSGDDQTRKQSLFLILGSLLLFALGSAGAWYAYNAFIDKTRTPPIAVPVNRFITSNTEVNLDITASSSRDVVISAISGAAGNVPGNELHHIQVPLSSSEFFQTLGSRAPGSLVRAFDPLFMFGALGQSNFLIIKLASFENAFAGMLLWEKNMAQDIGPLFTTAPLLKSIPVGATFTDVTDRNKDMRMLAIEGKSILLYSFFDNNMVIITDSIETLRTLIERLTREKLSH